MRSNRKTIGFGIAMVAGIALALVKGDVPNNLALMIETLFGAFIAGNAAEHWSKRGKPGASDSLLAAPEQASATVVDRTALPEEPPVSASSTPVVAVEDLFPAESDPYMERLAILEAGVLRSNQALDEIISYITRLEMARMQAESERR